MHIRNFRQEIILKIIQQRQNPSNKISPINRRNDGSVVIWKIGVSVARAYPLQHHYNVVIPMTKSRNLIVYQSIL